MNEWVDPNPPSTLFSARIQCGPRAAEQSRVHEPLTGVYKVTSQGEKEVDNEAGFLRHPRPKAIGRGP
ncbi:hypothetical protein VNO77_15073 [Canavalia gladiata]|uniref:Uncharacterized protein n=1 Tax=Canavalia gladiata TaxID=3824 RepID=A0AAN9LZX0_CANGL